MALNGITKTELLSWASPLKGALRGSCCLDHHQEAAPSFWLQNQATSAQMRKPPSRASVC